MPQIIRQFTAQKGGETFEAFAIEANGYTEPGAIQKAKVFLRSERPTANPFKVEVLDAQNAGKKQTSVLDFIPDEARQNSYIVEIGLKR